MKCVVLIFMWDCLISIIILSTDARGRDKIWFLIFRYSPLRWLQWFTYSRCLRNHSKCHFLQIELNNRFLHRIQKSIKVSLIVVDIDNLKIFKLYEHPEIRPKIEVMKTEFTKYQTLADSIKSFDERKDNKGKDNFDLSDWWKSNCGKLPAFT